MLRESFEMKGRVTRDNRIIRHRKNQEVQIKCLTTHLKKREILMSDHRRITIKIP